MSTSSTDRIEKKFVLKAPRSRVFRALTNAQEFGTWFGVELGGAFAPGIATRGRLTFANYQHVTIEMQIERIEPETYFSYRWHPYALDTAVDYSSETPTLVEFRLSEVDGGTELLIVESGFDRVPEARRAEAFRMNEGGWTTQGRLLEKYVTAG